ncbi:S-4TM family putative pore-forming effector [Nonomuraea sp. NPDC026600]|uniref:S-4TM family putative pore-forming effector n=1 Tax=Nonomuraea sp. NPDC026600 TaxID=3155363 RepID=UPI0033CC1BF4
MGAAPTRTVAPRAVASRAAADKSRIFTEAPRRSGWEDTFRSALIAGSGKPSVFHIPVVWPPDRGCSGAYGTTILLVGLAWFAIGVTIAIVGELTLTEYLIKIFLPSSPAFLDSIELSREHWRHAVAREQIENDIHDLWDRY